MNKKGSIFRLVLENLTTSFFVMLFIGLTLFYLNYIFGATVEYSTFVPDDVFDNVLVESVQSCLYYYDPLIYRVYPYVDINKFNEEHIGKCLSKKVNLEVEYDNKKKKINELDETEKEFTIPVLVYDKELYVGKMIIGI